jgi:hypothetical protein
LLPFLIKRNKSSCVAEIKEKDIKLTQPGRRAGVLDK